jgi:hypothetical protein
MGKEARLNPTAIAAGQGAFQVTEVLGFQFRTTLELTAEKRAELVALGDAALADGREPREVMPTWNPKENPEFFDYVVWNVPTVGRPSPLQIRADQVPTAAIKWSEFLRIHYPTIKERADASFAGVEARGADH